jgi:hypothetical protein
VLADAGLTAAPIIDHYGVGGGQAGPADSVVVAAQQKIN